MLGWSEEESGDDSEEEEEDEKEGEFKLPLSLRQQLHASSDEEDDAIKQSQSIPGIFVCDYKRQPICLHPFLEISDSAWGRKKKTFYAVEGEH